MRKRFPTLFQKESGFSYLESGDKTESDYSRAKEIYFANFASHMTMKKNGEFKEYCTYHILEDTEYAWSLDVKKQLVDEIFTGHDLLQVVNLSRINLPEKDIVDAFRTLVSSARWQEIQQTITRLKPLFEPAIYAKILSVEESADKFLETRQQFTDP